MGTCLDPQFHSITILEGRGGVAGLWRGRPGGGKGGTCRTRSALVEDPAVWSPDPGDGLRTCPDPQSHSVTILEGRGGGAALQRGCPGGGRGGHLYDPTGVGGGPRGLVPRPRRWLEDLSRPSVPLGHNPRGSGGQWQAAEGTPGRGGGGGHLMDPWVSSGGPRDLVLQPRRWIGYLSRPSFPLGRAPRGPGGR